MVTMLDYISRVPSLMEKILQHAQENFSRVFTAYSPSAIDEICLIGSGSSFNAASTARYLAEKAANVRVTVALPNEFLHAYSVRNPHALYVFISQTGSSTLTREALRHVKEKKLMNAAVSENADTSIAKAADAFIDMGCGHEEYGIRTIGYSTTVLTLMLLGMELGRRRGTLQQDEYKALVDQARAVSARIPAVIEATQRWMDRAKRKIMRSSFIAFTGTGALYGVAMEAAVKMWEAPQFPSAGY